MNDEALSEVKNRNGISHLNFETAQRRNGRQPMKRRSHSNMKQETFKRRRH